MSPKSIQRQSGHAAILFALFIPILFGVFALGTDGARAVQDKARLLEAIEVASLAVAGQGSDNKVLAKSYLQYYFPLAKINDADITINKINCEDNDACKGQDRRFFEYQVSARISQPTWFPGNDAIIGFGSDYQVYDGSVTRKYHSETVDIVLVADFSASMYDSWDGGHQKKYLDLKDIIKVIADELEQFNSYTINASNKNKLAVIGFDFYTIEIIDGFRYFRDHLVCRGDHRPNRENYNREVKCNSFNPGLNHNLINYKATVESVFEMNSIAHQLISSHQVTNVSRFHDIPLTVDMKFVKERVASNYFSIPRNTGSGTAFYAGLIRGAQVAYNQGDNSRQLIIILSDGVESHFSTTNRLVEHDLCSTIHDRLNSKKTKDGKIVKARIAAVGFDYVVKNNPQLGTCVGQGNIFQANDVASIKNKILELITEEIGHLAPQR
ncbi:TadE/TadG family type IV pilus assembly protein [Vibrio metschnikovii]|uniref:TadE/TadG family type IV pilus assembly protein n=1 Tax=Vibrio metschnikovii TaxID=28172 RepID=UPI002FCABBB0